MERRFRPYLRPKTCAGTLNVAHLAYRHAFWPVIEEALEDMPANSWIVVAEDSCWIMKETTPRLLRQLVEAHGGKSLWRGYCNKPSKKDAYTLTAHGDLCYRTVPVKVPFGSKMLVVNLRFVRDIRRFMMLTDLVWFADQRLKVMVASGLLEVTNPPLAASRAHFSLVSDKELGDLVPKVSATQQQQATLASAPVVLALPPLEPVGTSGAPTGSVSAS